MAELYLSNNENFYNKHPKYKLSELIEKQLNPKDSTPLNIYEIKNYIYYGFSDQNLRPIYWKVILEYYSKNKFKSEMYYLKARKAYTEIEIETKDEYIDLIEKDLLRSKCLLSNSEHSEYSKSIKNILLKFATTNSSIGYVQGMIEIVVPIYHVMISSKDLDTQKYAEEDTFYIFNNLMSEINDCFVRTCDNHEDGIKGRIEKIYDIVLEKDFDLYSDMLSKGLINTDFPIKWILQMFSTIFNLEDCLWLWDKIFSDSSRFEILNYLCAGIILLLKDVIMTNNFDSCMELLQNPSFLDVKVLFNVSDELRRSSKQYEEIFLELQK